MAEHQQHQYQQQQQHNEPQSHQFVKAATAVTASGSFLVLSGLLLVGTVITLTVATPLLVIFSPVLVPAVMTLVMIGGGFVTSGGLGVAALSVLSWLYQYLTGKHPPGADQLDDAKRMIASSTMAEHQQHQYQQQQQQQHNEPQSHQFVKAATAVAASGSFLVLSGLLLVGTVITLTVATPLLVIFSPVLVPAVITLVMIGGGFVTSGGLGVAALSVLSWLYQYLTGKHPPGADQLDDAKRMIASKARDAKEYGQHQLHSAQQQHAPSKA